jgi:hypothetical protein
MLQNGHTDTRTLGHKHVQCKHYIPTSYFFKIMSYTCATEYTVGDEEEMVLNIDTYRSYNTNRRKKQ